MFRRTARLDDLAALLDARTPAEFHKALVLGPPAAYERESSLPLTYFRKAHEHDPARSAETAMLIATDSRWSVVAGPIIEAIESTGIVPAEELDLLARAFISADTNVYWKCPDDWFSTTGFVISEVTGSPDPHELDPKNSDTSGPTVAARAIAPCLRRWAAARSLRLDPSIWHAVVARASEIGGSGGGGLMRGLLDSIESLPPEGRSLVGRMALKSGRADVRHEALRQLAHTDWALARMLGLRDANERVRRWASDLVDPSTLSAASEKPPAGAPARTKNSSRGQGFLFE